ncbi:MAG: AtpZ/AtpI family protein [Proteobacteria bacterium]|nr:AtpZ/AtpI family protein [Pseudomonadota bacterium]
MKKENRKFLREIAVHGSLGMSVSLSIVIGLGIGIWLDRKMPNAAPVFTLVFLGLGIAAGFKNILLAIKKSRKM